jgi:hypothetical protein
MKKSTNEPNGQPSNWTAVATALIGMIGAVIVAYITAHKTASNEVAQSKAGVPDSAQQGNWGFGEPSYHKTPEKWYTNDVDGIVTANVVSKVLTNILISAESHDFGRLESIGLQRASVIFPVRAHKPWIIHTSQTNWSDARLDINFFPVVVRK